MQDFNGIRCVSIAVPSIDDALPAYTEGLGLELVGEREESQRGYGMRWQELGRNGAAFIELIEPTGDEGPVAAFLAKGGASRVYQVRFAVDALDETLAELNDRGLQVLRGPDVEDQPSVGWVHPKSTGGVLFELVQFL